MKYHNKYLLIAATMIVLGCSPKQMVDTNEVYQTEQFGFAQGIVADGFLFTSGQVGWDTSYKLTGETFEDQLKQSFINLEKIINASGGTFNDVLHVKFYVKDLDEPKRRAVGHCMQKCFPTHYKPASTLLGVESLARAELLVEVEIIAKLNQSQLRN